MTGGLLRTSQRAMALQVCSRSACGQQHAELAMGGRLRRGCGIVFPRVQSDHPRHFDTGCRYLRRWWPELADVLLALLHEPRRDADLIRRSGYPPPMVEPGQSRQQALDAYGAPAR
jgi:hypothetical protein